MKFVKKLILNTFRCYEYASWEFDLGVNVIIGNNATGKTSMMEAIYMIGMCKSFRTNNERELIKNNTSFYAVQADINNSDLSLNDKVSIVGSMESKKIAKNEKVYKSFSEYLGDLNVVLFCPDDMRLVKGEPKFKRRFLDLNIGQMNKGYLKSLIEYNRYLKERNELLKMINYNGEAVSESNMSLLNIYTEKLIEKAKEIITFREKFINDINIYIERKVKIVSREKETGYLVYKPNVSITNIEKEMNNRLKHDLFNQTSSCGPHRDDFIVMINEKDASSYGSQGQQKTLALAIKLGLADVIRESNENVIIILDDIFGELDENRQMDLLKLINKDNQIFITSTSERYLSKDIIDNCNMIRL